MPSERHLRSGIACLVLAAGCLCAHADPGAIQEVRADDIAPMRPLLPSDKIYKIATDPIPDWHAARAKGLTTDQEKAASVVANDFCRARGPKQRAAIVRFATADDNSIVFQCAIVSGVADFAPGPDGRRPSALILAPP